MGLSLKKLGKDITSVLGGVERQVNPFDNGASYSKPHVAPGPSVISQLSHVPAQARNFGVSVARSIPRGVLEIGQTASQPLTHRNYLLPSDLGRTGEILLGREPITSSTQTARDVTKSLPGHKTIPTALAVPLGLALSSPIGPGKGKAALKRTAEDLPKVSTASRYLQATAARAGEVDAKRQTGMAALSQAEAGAKFGKDLTEATTSGQKLLAAPKQNFIIQQAENKRIMEGTDKLGKEYGKKYANLAKVWGSAPNRLKAEVDKLDTEFQGRHANLLNAVGEFTPQLPKVKATTKTATKPVVVTKTSATAPKIEEVLKQELSPTTARGIAQTPSALNRSWQTVSGVISQHGTGGQELARRLSEQRNQSEVGQQAFLDKIPKVAALKKNDFTTFVDTLDKLGKGQKVAMAPHIRSAVHQWNQAIPEIRNRAVKAGLDVGDLGPNYFPRQYKDLFSSDQALAKMANGMVESGKAKDLGDAMGKLQFMKNEYQRPFGNLEKTREFDMPGYEMTHDALKNYINRSFERVTKAEQLGPKNEKLNELQAKMQQEGYNAVPGSTVDKYIKIALGDVDKSTTAHQVSGAIRKVNALRSLSTAGLSNVTQLPVNTSTVAGIGRTGKGAIKTLVSPKAREEARQAGVVLDHSIQELAKQQGFVGGKVLRNIASPFFKEIEKFNRLATAVVGKDYGNHLAKKGDTQTLRGKFGVTGDIGKTLTRDQEIQMSRKLVELAQFKVDPMDLPAWVDSPTGKLIAQFRTFGYKQTDFMYNQVLREAVKGNFLPLARFTALSIPLGTATLAAKGAIKGTQYTQPDEGQASKTAKAVAAVGGFGLPGSEGQNIYKSNQYGNTPAALAGVVGGPTASFLTETATNIGDKGLAQGNWKPLEKEGVRSIPAVGPSIANRVFPKQTPDTNTTASGSNSNNPDLKGLKDSPPTGYYLQKTSDGVYAYALNDGKVHSASNLKDAQSAVARDIFGKSDQNIKVVGDKVYRKSANGAISVITKDSYDYQLGTAKLTSYKKSGDVKGWMETANSQLAILQKELDDPNTDPLDAIKYQNQAQAILDDMDKYQGYGGFTKPKTGGGGSGGSDGSAGSPYKYAVSLNSGGQPKRPKVSVRSAGSAPKARRGSSKPRVTTKKSLV